MANPFRPRTDIYKDAVAWRQFEGGYLVILLLGSLIALAGLLLNSPAVIIGAMLISPLMEPILATGLGLTLADFELAGKAVRNVALSVGECVAAAALGTWLSPLREATPEILARVHPNMMDLFIAVFAGAAGTLAICSKRQAATIVPGVAIATAVLPPLAVTGYGLATAQWAIAGGAAMLFVTNLAGIVVSADLTFLAIGFRPRQRMTEGEVERFVWGRMAVSLVLLAALSVPLARTLFSAGAQAAAHRTIADVIETALTPRGGRLENLDVRMSDGAAVAVAELSTARPLSAADIAGLERASTERLHAAVRLTVQQVQFAASPGEAAGTDFVAGRTSAAPAPAPKPAAALAASVAGVAAALARDVAPLGGAGVAVSGVSVEPGGVIAVRMSMRVPAPRDHADFALVGLALARELGGAVHLTGDVVTDAAAVGWPVSFAPGQAAPRAEDVARLRAALAKADASARWRLLLAASAGASLATARLAAVRAALGATSIDGVSTSSTIESADAGRLAPVDAIDVLTPAAAGDGGGS